MSDNVPASIRAQNRPVWSLLCAVLLVGLAIVALVFVPQEHADQLGLIIGAIVLAIPGLLAAGYSERTARDVRNGVVQQKAREGAQQALDDTGVTEVTAATQRGASVLAGIQALEQLTKSDAEKRDALARLLAPLPSTPATPSPAGEGPSTSTMPDGILRNP